jgi:hypothetical protein
MLLYHKMNIHVPSMVKAFKTSLVQGIRDYKKLHEAGVAQIISGFAISDIINHNPEFKHLQLPRTNLILMLFPRKIFKSIRSPQYIPYALLAKILMNEHQNFKLKTLILGLYGLSSVKYYNEDLSQRIGSYLESNVGVSL